MQCLVKLNCFSQLNSEIDHPRLPIKNKTEKRFCYFKSQPQSKQFDRMGFFSLTQRDRRQLSANLWRAKQVLRRNTKPIWCACICPFICIAIVVLMRMTVLDPFPEGSNAFDKYAVVSSETNATNYWVDGDEQQGLNTSLSLTNCTFWGFTRIGLIQPNGESAKAGNAALESIFDKINAAYVPNWQDMETLEKVVFKDDASLDSYVKKKDYANEGLCFALGWNHFDIDSKTFDIDLRWNPSQGPRTQGNQVGTDAALFNLNLEWEFYKTGFLQVMATVTEEVVSQLEGNGKFTVLATTLPTGEYENNGAASFTAQFFLPFILIMVGNIFSTLVGTVKEKHEYELFNILKRIGYREIVDVYQEAILATFCTLVFYTPCALLLTILLLPDVSVILTLLFSYLVAIQMFLLDAILQYALRGRGASVFKWGFYGIQFFLLLTISFGQQQTEAQIYMYCLFPMMQMVAYTNLASRAQNLQISLGFGTLTEPLIGTATMLNVILIVSAVTLALAVIFVYILPLRIAVDPDNPLKWYYPCVCGCLRKRATVDQTREQGTDEESHSQDPLLIRTIGASSCSAGPRTTNGSYSPTQDNVSAQSFLLSEEEHEYVTKGVMEPLTGAESQTRLVISKLKKKFRDTKAVDNLSLTLFNNQILVLLGHNGAGKSTTINMLTGLLKPSSGSATAIGVDPTRDVNLFEDYRDLVDFIGFCPQDNVLINKLTVKENLVFFCRFKGIQDYDQVIDGVLDQYNLKANENTFAKNLSGGQKRKLQLAIALLGKAKIVLLDEPSSGMDPTARREAWDIIQKAKQDRIIILTTHYMDEAEQLADRVAIISNGSLQVCGSTLFLKKKYGQGFFIEAEIDEISTNKTKDLKQILQQFTQQAGLDMQIVSRRNHGNVVYELPYQMKTNFTALFDQIDSNQSALGIKNYSVRSSTLEEVFISLREKEKEKESDKLLAKSQRGNLSETKGIYSPKVKENGFCRLFRLSFAFHFESSLYAGYICNIIIAVIAFTFAGLSSHFALRTVDNPLDYTDMAGIYNSVLPMDVYYNDMVGPPFTQSSTQPFMDSLVLAAGQGTLSLSAQSYPQKEIDQTWKDYYSSIADQIPQGTIGSYSIQQLLDPEDGSNSINAVVFGSLSSDASLGAYSAILLETIARQLSSEPDLKLSFTNHPLANNQIVSSLENTGVASNYATAVSIALIVIAAVIVQRQTRRIETRFYDNVLMRGATKWTYWLSSYFNDVLTILACLPVLYLSLVIFDISGPGFGLLWIQYAFAEPLFLYTWIYISSVAIRGPLWLAGVLSLLSIVLSQVGTTLGATLILIPAPIFETLADYFFLACSLTPAGNYMAGQTRILMKFPTHLWKTFDPESLADGTLWYGPYGAESNIKIAIALTIGYGVVFSLLLCGCCDCRPRRKKVNPVHEIYEDTDVKAERNRVATKIMDLHDVGRQSHGLNSGAKELVLVKDLVKKYYKKDSNSRLDESQDQDQLLTGRDSTSQHPYFKKEETGKGAFAVKGISFGVDRGECFALLGLNGAGKSTTFKCLTAYDIASGGQIALQGQDVKGFFKKFDRMHGLVGYCPQFNCIDPSLSVRTTLKYFAEISGVVDDEVDMATQTIIEKVGLQGYEQVSAGRLSGGNKRKLTLAMAIIGRPQIIYIDEASAGVDPAARRTLWKAIQSEGAESAVIVTTHVMEEAEELSSKLAIMVSGQIQCFGTLAHIRQKYGRGFEIELKIDLNDPLKKVSQPLDSSHNTLKTNLMSWQRTFEGISIPINFDFANQLSSTGLLAAYYRQCQQNKQVNAQSMQVEIAMQNLAKSICSVITKNASETKLQSVDGTRMRLTLARNNLSFGKIYTILQQMQEKLLISEYQVKESSLEQVFNQFACGDAQANQPLISTQNQLI